MSQDFYEEGPELFAMDDGEVSRVHTHTHTHTEQEQTDRYTHTHTHTHTQNRLTEQAQNRLTDGSSERLTCVMLCYPLFNLHRCVYVCVYVCVSVRVQVAAYRRQLEMRVAGFDAPKPIKEFNQCGFDNALMAAIKKAG